MLNQLTHYHETNSYIYAYVCVCVCPYIYSMYMKYKNYAHINIREEIKLIVVICKPSMEGEGVARLEPTTAVCLHRRWRHQWNTRGYGQPTDSPCSEKKCSFYVVGTSDYTCDPKNIFTFVQNPMSFPTFIQISLLNKFF